MKDRQVIMLDSSKLGDISDGATAIFKAPDGTTHELKEYSSEKSKEYAGLALVKNDIEYVIRWTSELSSVYEANKDGGVDWMLTRIIHETA